MNKKTYILSFLLLAYSVMLVHNFIPHHHHESLSEAKHHHDHEQTDHNHENSEGDSDETNQIFHLDHAGNAKNEVFVSHSGDISIIKAKSSLPITILNKIHFNSAKVHKPRHPDFSGLLVLSEQYQSSFTLRGPPDFYI